MNKSHRDAQFCACIQVFNLQEIAAVLMMLISCVVPLDIDLRNSSQDSIKTVSQLCQQI